VSGRRADAGRQRGADQRQRRLPAARAAQLLQHDARPGRRTAGQHTINNNAMLAKVDWSVTPANNLSASYNFDYSKNTNQTFDVPTYGTSANGTEGPSKINVVNVNLFSTLQRERLNEFHSPTRARIDRARRRRLPCRPTRRWALRQRFGSATRSSWRRTSTSSSRASS
jgi:hypothetical protein